MMLLAVGCLAGSCTDDDEYTQGVWMRRSDLDGVARGQASSFTIDNKGYLCCGFRGTNKTYLKDLWVYDINNDYWTQCADMPDEAQGRHSATAFALNGKGYRDKFCALSLADFCPMEYGGFPTITLTCVAICFFTRLELSWKNSVNSSLCFFSASWKVSVRQMPLYGR